MAFHILLNLAEDVTVERKMVKKSLIDSLLRMLEHTNADLLILIVTFLRKLAVFQENKNVMKELDVVGKIIKFVPSSSQALVVATLRLLFNLSFDPELRERMLNAGMVTKLVGLLKAVSLRGRTVKLLYQLSVEDRCKTMFGFSEGIQILVDLIINFPKNNLTPELGALAINMTLSDRNCEKMVENRGLNHIIDRLATTRDPLLFKVTLTLTLTLMLMLTPTLTL